MVDTVTVQYDAVSDEHYIAWDGLEKETGWKPGDTIIWIENYLSQILVYQHWVLDLI